MNNFQEKYMDEHLPKRVGWAVAFALVFIIIGLFLPDLYYKYLDQTQYYSVQQPIPVAQKWYKPCDDVVMTAIRDSRFDVSGTVQTDLVLKQGNNEIFKVPNVKFNRGISVKKGNSVTVSFSYRLPCDLADGVYYWQLSFSYKVRGFDKEYVAISDLFNVNQYGVDPELIKIATESGSLRSDPIRNPSVRVVTPTPAPTSAPAQNTTVINNNAAPQSTSAPTPTPNQPNPPVPSGVCLPVLGCILK